MKELQAAEGSTNDKMLKLSVETGGCLGSNMCLMWMTKAAQMTGMRVCIRVCLPVYILIEC